MQKPHTIGAKKASASGDAIELHEVKEENGEISLQCATTLHALGGSIYKLGRFEELQEMSKEIVRSWHAIKHLRSAGADRGVGADACERGNRRGQCRHSHLVTDKETDADTGTDRGNARVGPHVSAGSCYPR